MQRIDQDAPEFVILTGIEAAKVRLHRGLITDLAAPGSHEEYVVRRGGTCRECGQRVAVQYDPIHHGVCAVCLPDHR